MCTPTRVRGLGRIPLNEELACCKDLYLTTQNTLNRQTSIPLAWLKPTIPASKQAAEDLCLRSWATSISFSYSNFKNWVPQYHMHSTPNGRGDSEMLCSFRISICYRLLSITFQNQITNPSCLAFWITLQQGKSYNLWKNWHWVLSQSYTTSKLVSLGTRIICMTWNANNCVCEHNNWSLR